VYPARDPTVRDVDKPVTRADNRTFLRRWGEFLRAARMRGVLTHGRSAAMKVKDAMHEGCEWVSPDTRVTEIAKLMRKSDIGAVPVGENDKLVGMVTDRDICCKGVANGHDIDMLTARDVMSVGIAYCRDSDDVEDAAELMERRRIRRLPVIDKNKRMVGMLSLGDISHSATPSLTAELTQAVSAHHG
jgi:predicted transcriptional regulator